jgi:hypothetical protein
LKNLILIQLSGHYVILCHYNSLYVTMI